MCSGKVLFVFSRHFLDCNIVVRKYLSEEEILDVINVIKLFIEKQKNKKID